MSINQNISNPCVTFTGSTLLHCHPPCLVWQSSLGAEHRPFPENLVNHPCILIWDFCNDNLWIKIIYIKTLRVYSSPPIPQNSATGLLICVKFKFGLLNEIHPKMTGTRLHFPRIFPSRKFRKFLHWNGGTVSYSNAPPKFINFHWIS